MRTGKETVLCPSREAGGSIAARLHHRPFRSTTPGSISVSDPGRPSMIERSNQFFVVPAVLMTLITLLATPADASNHDVVFLLDTTGSMQGEIQEARERIRQIAQMLASGRREGAVRIGVVAFRDRGDVYVTRLSPLDPDVETSFRFLAS